MVAPADRPVRRVLVFTTVALALLMMSVDATILATALHALQHGLGTSINWAGWTLTAYAWLVGGAAVLGLGYGTTNPASRNAGLQLAPEHASTLAALRTMCLQLGSIVTVSVATAAVAHARDPGAVQAWVFVGAALLLLVSLPLIARVPEHRGAW